MNTHLLYTDVLGILIPAYTGEYIRGLDIVNPEALDIIPDLNEDNEGYWEAWDDLLALDWVFEQDGIKYSLYQDGDLWAIAEGEEDMFNPMI